MRQIQVPTIASKCSGAVTIYTYLLYLSLLPSSHLSAGQHTGPLRQTDGPAVPVFMFPQVSTCGPFLKDRVIRDGTRICILENVFPRWIDSCDCPGEEVSLSISTCKLGLQTPRLEGIGEAAGFLPAVFVKGVDTVRPLQHVATGKGEL